MTRPRSRPDFICEACGRSAPGHRSNANRFCSRLCYDEARETWLPDWDNTLIRMWSWHTCQQIATAIHDLGKVGCTANAVIGRAHRLMLPLKAPARVRRNIRRSMVA